MPDKAVLPIQTGSASAPAGWRSPLPACCVEACFAADSCGTFPLGQVIQPKRLSRNRWRPTTMGAHTDLGRQCGPVREERSRVVVIQLGCIGRAQPDDLRTILPALAAAAEAVDLDHSRLAAVLDWVQYRHNFRAPVMVRPFGRDPARNRAGGELPLAEIAIDLRRAKDMPYETLVADIVDRLAKALGLAPDVHECIHLEDWVRPSKSVIWSFNHAYWRHLKAWDTTFKKDYASALPGGESDGTNIAFWRDQIAAFHANPRSPRGVVGSAGSHSRARVPRWVTAGRPKYGLSSSAARAKSRAATT